MCSRRVRSDPNTPSAPPALSLSLSLCPLPTSLSLSLLPSGPLSPTLALHALRQPGQHRRDLVQQLLPLLVPPLRDDLQPDADVEDRRALRRRAQRDEVIAPLVGPRKLAGALCDVERDRGRGAGELVGDMAAAAGEVLDEVGRKGEEGEGGLVDDEALVD